MTDDAPTASVQLARRWRWVWIIPIAAVVFAGLLYQRHMAQRGRLITVRMAHGHGIKAGAALRCRGIVVGAVEMATLNKTLDGVVLSVRLAPQSKGIAVQGSRFWVVRPRLSVTGVGGLETIAGPQYLAVMPGDGERADTFDALEHPPPVEAIDPEGLVLSLKAAQRGSLRPGAPVTYRQVHVGAVLTVDLAQDGSHVYIQAYIQPPFAFTVRENSMFWNVSGAGLDLGIKGLRFEVESLQTLLDGGIAYATPEQFGKPAVTGQTFTLHDKADDDWLDWQPNLTGGPPPAQEDRSLIDRLFGRD